MRHEFKAKVILLDIEGTTTSISFVKDTLFPYAKKHSAAYLNENWHKHEIQEIVAKLTNLEQFNYFRREAAYNEDQELTPKLIGQFVNYLIDKDLKLEPLKTLQGLVWDKGYKTDVLRGNVYDDVPAMFKVWTDVGINLAIYSSGSVKAQQLLFEYSELGNLLPFISRHFDTAIGQKQEVKSYNRIAEQLNVESSHILFLTDIIKEAEAARAAGMQTVILSRTGNAPLTDDEKTEFIIANDFYQLLVSSPDT